MLFTRTGSFRQRPIADYLGNDISARWLKMLLMYAYSMPQEPLQVEPGADALIYENSESNLAGIR
jgi:hypothetical protein